MRHFFTINTGGNLNQSFKLIKSRWKGMIKMILYWNFVKKFLCERYIRTFFRYIVWQSFDLFCIKGFFREKQRYIWKSKLPVSSNITCFKGSFKKFKSDDLEVILSEKILYEMILESSMKAQKLFILLKEIARWMLLQKYYSIV